MIKMKNLIKKMELGEYGIIALFGIVMLISQFTGFSFGTAIAGNFWSFFVEMILFLPLMFILIGMIDVWIPKEKVEQHIGKEAGIRGMAWVILLAMVQVGPLYGAFPVAYLLWKKGCSIRNTFIYLGAFSTLKIPMITFEIGFLGWKFSVLRILFALPTVMLIGSFMDFYLRKKQFDVKSPGVEKKKERAGVEHDFGPDSEK